MHTRLVSFSDTKDVETGLSFVRDTVIPLLEQQPGYRGLSANADRENHVFAVLSLWDTAEERDASDAVLAPTRAEAADLLGGDVKVETFEELVFQIGEQPPEPGSWVIVTTFHMDPSTIEDNIAFFKSDVLPQITATPGFRGVRNMINRETGDGIVGTAWTDRAAMERAAEEAVARREVARARGITFGDVSFREILLFQPH